MLGAFATFAFSIVLLFGFTEFFLKYTKTPKQTLHYGLCVKHKNIRKIKKTVVTVCLCLIIVLFGIVEYNYPSSLNLFKVFYVILLILLWANFVTTPHIVYVSHLVKQQQYTFLLKVPNEAFLVSLPVDDCSSNDSANI